MADGTEISIQSEDVGTVVKGTAFTRTDGTDTVIDINDLSNITITLTDPENTATTATATALNVDGGTDGIWTFTTSTAVFTLSPGVWKIQAKYTYSTGDVLYSQIKFFNVGEVLTGK